MESKSEHLRFVGTEAAVVDFHHGMLRPVVGASHYQVLRANRSRFHHADGFGWTYNHAPMLAYWKGKFYLQYLSNPSGEHVPPGHTLITTSPDGIDWEFPREVFPFYRIPPGVYKSPEGYRMAEPAYAVMHQRMGFYTAADGRLLTLGFYGICSTTMDYPNTGDGIGRVVREVHPDGSFGPIYFIRYNRHAGWDEKNTEYPFFRQSDDAGFVRACEELLEDRLVTLQWWEEDRSTDGFYSAPGGKALSWYHLDDGRVVGLWKHSLTALSEDEGRTWTPLRREPSFVMAGGKVWGQRTPDGRYAMLYNPSPDNVHRWPLALASSDDGLLYRDLLLVNGKVSPRRYQGGHKDPGMNYVRGFPEGNGTPPGDAFWVAYSMNKEDIWISRVPVPVRSEVETPVDDDFARFAVGRIVPGWNLHCGQWAGVQVIEREDGRGNCLRLQDEDRADTAQAERVMPESRQVNVQFSIVPAQNRGGSLHIEFTDPRGLAGALVVLDEDGWIRARSGCDMRLLGEYAAGESYRFQVELDAVAQRYSVRIEGREEWRDLFLFRPLQSFQRIVFRTGPEPEHESLSLRSTRRPHEDELPFTSIPGADDPAPPVIFDLEFLRSEHGDGGVEEGRKRADPVEHEGVSS